MKSIKYNTILIMLLVAIAIAGCKKDFLNLSPTESIGIGEAFNTNAKIEAAITGIYDLVTNSGYTPNIIMNADVKGEDVLVNSTSNFNRFVGGYQYIETVNNGELEIHWRYAYRIIANCNQIIENVPNSPIADAEKAEYIAEARALRAYAHFQLVREFATPYTVNPNALGVPVVEKNIGVNDEFPARATVSQVYTSIVDDLKFAETNFPTGKNDVYRLTQNSIRGLLARAYLTMGDWENARDYAILARAGRVLGTGESLLAGFADPTSEWIWGYDVRSDDNQGFLQVPSFYDPYDVGYSSFRASKEFFDSFAANDIRQNQFRIPTNLGDDVKTGVFRVLGNGNLMSKFIFRGAWDNDQVLMRSSEMYLIEAESEARIGGATSDLAAQTALFAIQSRAIPAAVISTNTGTALIDEILMERRKELFGEGHRYYDILRTNQTLDRSASVSHWSKLVLPPGDPKRLLPIPQKEVDANPNVVPN